MRKKTICSICDIEIGVYVPYTFNSLGENFCMPCAAIILEEESKRKREIEYYTPNICARCNLKITGEYYSDRKPDGTRTGRNICSPCVAKEDSEIIEVVVNIKEEIKWLN